MQQLSPAFSSRPRHLLAVVLIALAALAAYANSFGVPFVYDDITSIVQNRVIRDLPAFLQGEGLKYNPRRFVTYLSFAFNYGMGGLDVTGYHIFNLVLHIATGMALYVFTLVTLRTPRLRSSRLAGLGTPVALLSALLFVCHPVQVEAVTYVVQRTTALAAFFYLLSVLMYAMARLQERRGKALSLFAGALIAAVAAMLSKEIAATLPFAVLLYEVSFFNASRLTRLRLAAPLIALSLLVPLMLMAAGRPAGELLSAADRLTRETELIPRGQYLTTQFEVVATYLRLLILPYGQNIDHDYRLATGFFAPLVFLAFLLHAALLALAAWLYRTASGASGDPARRLIGFGIFWFYLALLVESSVIPIRDVINEHRLYLPSIGLALACSAGLILLLERRPRLLKAAGGLIVLLLCITTWRRNEVWRSELTLWYDSASKSSVSGRPYHNYAKALSEAGDHGKAIVAYQVAIRRGTASPDTYVNLAAEYETLGDQARAEEFYRAALASDPAHVTALTRLAILLLQRPQAAQEGFALLQKAAQAAPANPNVQFNLGAAYEAHGDLAAAAEHYLQAVALNPSYAKAHYTLGELYRKAGRPDLAAPHLRAAQELEPPQNQRKDAEPQRR
ncbi:tetratricopeptide repeat protein [Geomonas ferrireducens]|uniref:tetratricopeptide repeat protein n=1 Tax=Geomonas ferrireducens TaxID=2570227 RepID=UPI0010A8B706|nr:tetratricopeptide repeat protein [Geomonas ferrireducens]